MGRGSAGEWARGRRAWGARREGAMGLGAGTAVVYVQFGDSRQAYVGRGCSLGWGADAWRHERDRRCSVRRKRRLPWGISAVGRVRFGRGTAGDGPTGVPTCLIRIPNLNVGIEHSNQKDFSAPGAVRRWTSQMSSVEMTMPDYCWRHQEPTLRLDFDIPSLWDGFRMGPFIRNSTGKVGMSRDPFFHH